MIYKIRLAILIIGGVNWGLIGILNFDLVAFLFGSAQSIISRAIYTVVGISALCCIPILFSNQSQSDL